MVDVVFVFGVITGIVFLGFFAELLFKKTNIPDVLLLIFIGILLGTFLQWVEVKSFGNATTIFTTFALVFILFQGALNINFKSLLNALGSTVALTVLSFVLTVITISLVAYSILDFPIFLAMLVGTILGGTSSAIVIPIVSNLTTVKEKYKVALTLESALSDVLCIVGTLTILQILLTVQIEGSGVFNSILSSFALAIIVEGTLGLAWMFILHKFEILKSSYMITIASVLGVYAFVESNFVGANGAIAVLVFGLILGNSKLILGIKQNNENSISNKSSSKEKSKNKNSTKLKKEETIHQETIHHSITVINTPAKNFYSEISFAVKTFFFVYLGLLIDFSNLDVFWYGALLTLVIYLVRPFAVRLVFGKEKPEHFDRTVLEILIPKGLAAAVLAGVVVQSGVLQEAATAFATMVLSVVLISIILTSVLLILAKNNLFKGFFPILGEYENK